jgi:hypothetical protein
MSKNRGKRGRRRRGRNRNRKKGRRNKRRNKKTSKEKFGGRDPRNVESNRSNEPRELNAFELFCAYHLGITKDNRYQNQPSLKNVAKQFGRNRNQIRDALSASGLDDESMRASDYDLSLARLDIKVAPDGIDKRELARPLFDEFVETHPKFVDWSEGDDTDSGDEASEDGEDDAPRRRRRRRRRD